MTAQTGWELVRAETAPGPVAPALKGRSGPGGDAAVLDARFDFGARPELLASFPFPHQLALEVRLDASALTVATTITATGDRPVPVAFGWHPYFRLPGEPRHGWVLHLPRREHMALDGRGLPTGEGEPEEPEAEPIGSRTFDDLYRLTGDMELALEGGGRRITVVYEEGYPYAQVFAPPGEQFACLEPMTAPTNSLVTGGYRQVEPGQRATARFAIRVDPTG